MKFEEVLPAFKQGKEITRWSDYTIRWKNNKPGDASEIMKAHTSGMNTNMRFPGLMDILATDWRIVEDDNLLTHKAMNIVSQLADFWEIPVALRQTTNDLCDTFVLKILKECQK